MVASHPQTTFKHMKKVKFVRDYMFEILVASHFYLKARAGHRVQGSHYRWSLQIKDHCQNTHDKYRGKSSVELLLGNSPILN